MQITNDANLPESLYQAIVAQQQQHSVGEADISCTQLLDGPLIGWMWRNYGDQVTEDAAVYPAGELLRNGCGHCMAPLLILFWEGMPERGIMWKQKRPLAGNAKRARW